jgi:hypothetical protein
VPAQGRRARRSIRRRLRPPLSPSITAPKHTPASLPRSFDGFKWLNDLHVLDVGKWNDSAIALSSVYGLLHDLAWLVNNPESFPDVEFLVPEHGPDDGGGGRAPLARVVGHKAILAARSPHFRAMFTSGMRESREPVIELHDEVWTKVRLARRRGWKVRARGQRAAKRSQTRR